MERFKDHCTVISGFAFKSADLHDYDDIPIIKIGNISNGGNIDIKKETQYVSNEFLSIDKKYHINCGDILISLTGSHINQPNSMVGRSCRSYDTDTYLLNQRAGKVICNDDTNDDYMYYLLNLRAVKENIVNRAYGAANQVNVSPSDIMKIKWTFPDIIIQNRIGAILSNYDKLIFINTKRIKTLEQMAENLYKEWFVRFRFPGHENAEFEKENPKNWIINYTNTMKRPKTWRYAKLSEFGEFIRGKNITSEQMVEGEIPVISAGIEPSGYHNQSNVHGECITISASGANAGLLKYNLSDIWAADCSYYQNDENLWFVYNSLRFLQKLLFNLQCGAAQPHVYPKHINKISIIKPDDNLIVQYCNTVKPFYDEIYKLMKSNENLIKQRDLLLPRLMSGKLEV